MKAQNATNWKQLLPSASKEGTLFQNDQVEISLQMQFMKFLGRYLLSFKSTSG